MADKVKIKLKARKAIGAVLGAAYGDALGWPNERPSKSKVFQDTKMHPKQFRKWSRRSGLHFSPYEETIKEGEYSDDTQLILCLSRSLLKGKEWMNFYSQVELPFWSLYERGGGGATKKAAKSWLSGKEPWSQKCKPQDVKKYFEAGGNGVAMRAVPHVIYLGEKNFSEVAKSIFSDGITTHGHPRALLGALAYGFALWYALRKETTLGYGELIEKLIINKSKWSSSSLLKSDSTWLAQAEEHTEDYHKQWASAKNEILEYLKICKSDMSQGMLPENDTLKSLDCFDKGICGAGTVAAVASVYLASYHAADPINGVTRAAFAAGADTDTIASMTGGLLGCVRGVDWLSSVKNGIQDFKYLEKVALKLSAGKSDDDSDLKSIKAVKRGSLNKLRNDVFSLPGSSEVELLDGRMAVLSHGQDQIGYNKKYKVEFRWLTTSDDQTIYLNKISKGNFDNQQSLIEAAPVKEAVYVKETAPDGEQLIQQSGEPNLSTKLLVISMEKSVSFYEDLLGLTIKKQTKDMMVFNQGISIVSETYSKELQLRKFQSLLCVDVVDIENIYKLISKKSKESEDINIITEIGSWRQSKRRFFRCHDPDGNVVEVFDKQ